jgi:tryptophanyl-tRNA synthetase
LLAAGLSPDRCTIFVQSHVQEHTSMLWVLGSVATMGELHRMTHFKEKARSGNTSASLDLFGYPVLQAADILLYQAEAVPVGDDQRQHIELTRDLARRFNSCYGDVFTLPEATTPPLGARIMDLQNVTRKMSKSDALGRGRVLLTDSDDAIASKIRRAVTDSGTTVRPGGDKPGITNLLTIYAVTTGEDIATVTEQFTGVKYGEFKRAVTEAVVAEVRPIRERLETLSADTGEVMRQLAIGAEKAQLVAAGTLAHAHDAIGLLAPRAASRPAPSALVA